MIICVNTYEVPDESADAFEKAFRSVVALLSQKPGFVRVRLHRARGTAGKFMTYAEWSSLDDQKAAGTDPALAPLMKAVLAIARPQAEWFEVVFEGNQAG